MPFTSLRFFCHIKHLQGFRFQALQDLLEEILQSFGTTTSSEQRETFTAHMLRAFVRLFDELDALQAKGDVEGVVEDIETAVGEAPDLGLEAPPEDQKADDIADELEELMEAILNEVDIDIVDDEMDIVSDDEKEEEEKEIENNKTQTEKDFEKKKESDKEKEEFGSGLEGDANGQ